MNNNSKWLNVAKCLPAGHRKKIRCCSTDTSMNVWNGDKGYSCYCHRCGFTEFEAHGLFSIGMLQRRKAERDAQSTTNYDLPLDYTTDIPVSEAVWFYKAGISPDVARAYGFGYSAKLQRIIMPVFPEGYIARLKVGKPKYIERVPSGTIFTPNPMASPMAYKPNYFGLDAVLTEDILSAIRVSDHVFGCALLGTTFGSGELANLLSAIQRSKSEAGTIASGIHIGLWLDPDKAGNRGTNRVQMVLGLQGIRCTRINSTLDPKYYTKDQIRRYLAGYQPSPANAE